MKLLALLKANAGRGAGLRALADSATLYIYDQIVHDDIFGGVTPVQVAKALDSIRDAEEIHIRIDSPGGDVFAARAIEQLLREHPARVVAHVDGIAASAASLLVASADKAIAAPGSMLMIHKAWTLAIGNADDMLETAALLEKVDGQLAETYARRTGKSPGEMLDAMREETWLTAEEAVAYGLVDEIYQASAQASARQWDLSAYHRAPVTGCQPEASPQGDDPGVDMEHLRRRLRVALIGAGVPA